LGGGLSWARDEDEINIKQEAEARKTTFILFSGTAH
jgi:hypothetical protein